MLFYFTKIYSKRFSLFSNLTAEGDSLFGVPSRFVFYSLMCTVQLAKAGLVLQINQNFLLGLNKCTGFVKLLLECLEGRKLSIYFHRPRK